MLISALGVVFTRRAATDEAVHDAAALTDVTAESVVTPALEDGLLRGDRAAIARVDGVVRGRVLDQQIVRVKIWRQDGTVLYSDEPRLIGTRYSLGDDDLDVLRNGGTEAEVSDLSRPENRFERKWKKLLEVYRGVAAPNGERVLYEAYLPYDEVTSLAGRVWKSFLPGLLVGLLLLWAIQAPLAWRLARRLEEGQRQRVRLLKRAADASENERRRIAADLHDGVVQGLAGSSYSLAAASEGARRAGAVAVDDNVDQVAADLRRWVRELRTLLVTIVPPKLHEEGLGPAMSDLAATVAGRGLAATVDVEPGLALDRSVEALVFRAAQEAVRNAGAHAGASAVSVRVCRDDGLVRLEVIDDGRGFEVERQTAAASEGHMGLALLGTLAEEAGGVLQVDSVPGRGTRVRLEVPACAV
jgi:signal transduction histidine kinase